MLRKHVYLCYVTAAVVDDWALSFCYLCPSPLCSHDHFCAVGCAIHLWNGSNIYASLYL